MTPVQELTDEQFQEHALSILERELGVDGLVRFLRLYRPIVTAAHSLRTPLVGHLYGREKAVSYPHMTTPAFPGTEDYTAERHKWLAGITVADIARELNSEG